MKLMRHTGSVLLFMLTGYFLNAQTEQAAEKKKTEFKISANYNTGLNYYGRVDSLHSSGFFPLAELWFNESLYINAAPVFVNNTAASFQYAGTITSIGYQFKSENKWLGNIYLVKPFYQESSKLVQSALKAQTGITLTWLNKVVNVTGGADAKFSDKTDFGVTAGLDHIFRYQINDKSVLVIDPSAYINAGTQQFTKSYLKKTSGFLFFPGNEQLVTESAQKFKILSYEFSAPVIFATGKFQLLFTPAYVIPQNLLIVEGRPDLSEKGEKMFYATIGAKLSF
jgi:tetratricopeptide (TPR) repeat protein